MGCHGGHAHGRPSVHHRARGSGPPRGRGGAFAAPLGVRAAVFTILAGSAVAAALWFLWPRGGGQEAADVTVRVTMAGFSQPILRARAGQPLRVRLVNPDSSFHTDGGGWHQLAIPDLGVDVRVAPRSERVVVIPAAAPGEYEFYCDVCCGGKENPTMRGVLRVEA